MTFSRACDPHARRDRPVRCTGCADRYGPASGATRGLVGGPAGGRLTSPGRAWRAAHAPAWPAQASGGGRQRPARTGSGRARRCRSVRGVPQQVHDMVVPGRRSCGPLPAHSQAARWPGKVVTNGSLCAPKGGRFRLSRGCPARGEPADVGWPGPAACACGAGARFVLSVSRQAPLRRLSLPSGGRRPVNTRTGDGLSHCGAPRPGGRDPISIIPDGTPGRAAQNRPCRAWVIIKIPHLRGANRPASLYHEIYRVRENDQYRTMRR